MTPAFKKFLLFIVSLLVCFLVFFLVRRSLAGDDIGGLIASLLFFIVSVPCLYILLKILLKGFIYNNVSQNEKISSKELVGLGLIFAFFYEYLFGILPIYMGEIAGLRGVDVSDGVFPLPEFIVRGLVAGFLYLSFLFLPFFLTRPIPLRKRIIYCALYCFAPLIIIGLYALFKK